MPITKLNRFFYFLQIWSDGGIYACELHAQKTSMLRRIYEEVLTHSEPGAEALYNRNERRARRTRAKAMHHAEMLDDLAFVTELDLDAEMVAFGEVECAAAKPTIAVMLDPRDGLPSIIDAFDTEEAANTFVMQLESVKGSKELYYESMSCDLVD